MDDLVERLRARAEFEDARVLKEVMRDGFEPVAYTGSESGRMLREAAAALEAAREDVERLDFLDSRRGDDVQPEPGSGDPVLVAHYWSVEGQCYDVRTAIDAAREARNG